MTDELTGLRRWWRGFVERHLIAGIPMDDERLRWRARSEQAQQHNHQDHDDEDDDDGLEH